ncbi:hypothetical protein KUTeg_020188 [Tegillarca granosa]|uniref:Caveolin n=1 Tax=Tegillarca granosa TaxID=220873 RepID=A0ABQ9E9W3_TEGGR|nr:hypothetical protein KUTeg_020188 [Tegillarca granosa]
MSQTTDELDLEKRDPNDLNSHVQVAFEDVFGEPAGAHSIGCVWRNSYKCFNCGKNCCYKLLTTLCGICIALYWGCEFAMITFQHVWCYTPMLRVLAISMGCLQKCYGTIITCFLAPLCETCGLFFSRISVSNSLQPPIPLNMSQQTEDAGIDMDQRDPNNLNDHVKVAFEDVLGEPEGAHSINCVWKNSYKCFNCGKNCCYKFLTTLCGIFIALYWGCEFAMITFQHVWCFTPSLRVLAIMMGCCQKCYGTIITCFLAPLCETCGLFFSKIGVENK